MPFFCLHFQEFIQFKIPDHPLVRKTGLGSPCELQRVSLLYIMGRCLLVAEMLKRICYNQELWNICTICKKLWKNSLIFFSSSSSHSLHPVSVMFALEDKLLFAWMIMLCIVSLRRLAWLNSSKTTRNSRRKQFIAVTLQPGWASLSVYKVVSICIDWIILSIFSKSFITNSHFASVLGRPALIEPKMKTWMPASVKKWQCKSKHK